MCCKHCQSPFMEPGPFAALLLWSSLSFCVTWLGSPIWGTPRTLHFYWDSTTSSNMFGEIIIPPGPGDGHNPAHRAGVGIADRCDGLFPSGATAAGCNLKKPWGGAPNSQLLQFWGIRKAKKIMVWSHMFLSCPPALPSMPGTYSPSHKPSFDTEKNLAKHGKETVYLNLVYAKYYVQIPSSPISWQ